MYMGDSVGSLVVADLCSAIADYIDANPKGAANTARKLSSTLTSRVARHDQVQDQELVIGELRAKSDKPQF